MLKHFSMSIIFLACSQTVFASNFFNVTSNGPSAQITVLLCLNGKGQLSCQKYTTSALNLSIFTTIPNHNYPEAGIKILTPGYKPSGCTLYSNGYCLFSASNTNAATITAIPQTCQSQADVVTFSPVATSVNNPTGSTANAPQQFTINMTMCDSQGNTLVPSVNNPIHINVYGAPDGVISPSVTTSSTGSVTFTYNGHAFPNNISINAWISDSTNHGAALGVTQVLHKNTPACTYGTTSYQVPLVSTLPDGLEIQADVGYDTGDSTSTFKDYTIDTGSLGVVVPISELPKNGNVIGPGAPGVKYYDSSGNTYSGYYYLAPVRVKLASGAVKTQPIMVLGINKAYCTGPTSRSCYSQPPSPTLHYMGVGFNRNSTTAGDLFDSPADNAFLHLTNVDFNGTDITPGYYLTPGDPSPTGLVLGITSTTGYDVVNLSPNTAVPGDFLPQAGCFSFPDSSSPTPFCGTALLDVGIDYMFIDLPKAQWPAGTHDANDLVPAGVTMHISMGDQSSPAMHYNFNAVQSDPPSATATPSKVQWIDTTSTGMKFVNTGRRPLYIYNYLYNGQCGQVGFKSVSCLNCEKK